MRTLMCLFVLVTLTCCGTTGKAIIKASGSNQLTTANADTFSVIKAKIFDHKDEYLHKKLSLLLKDLPYPVKSYIYRADSLNKLSIGIIISFYNKAKADDLYKKHISSTLIVIDWEKPIPLTTAELVYQNSKGEWQDGEAFMYNKQVIGDIGIVEFDK